MTVKFIKTWTDYCLIVAIILTIWKRIFAKFCIMCDTVVLELYYAKWSLSSRSTTTFAVEDCCEQDDLHQCTMAARSRYSLLITCNRRSSQSTACLTNSLLWGCAYCVTALQYLGSSSTRWESTLIAWHLCLHNLTVQFVVTSGTNIVITGVNFKIMYIVILNLYSLIQTEKN